ncbi:hypothetical protein ACFWPK_22415 [Nocardia sp. NPDC058519]|uniref:hypothetical protein n=1 Tax=Nocardia sp. NPDC058519 TaxID=3346535 RepID=UPI00365B23CF
MNALDWIAREKSWPQFFRFYRKVSRTVGSETHSALLTDPDLAAEIGPVKRQKHPDPVGFTAEMHALRDLGDIMLAQIVKDPRTAALPRPLTGAEMHALRKRQAGMNRLVSQFSPQHVGLTPQLDA